MSDSIKLHTMDLFSRFFQENQEKFLTFAYSYLRDKAEAEDVLMESMIALWENRNRWEEGSNLHPKDHPQNQTNKPPKPSHKPHQHTSEAHHTPLINTHPKLISQVPQNSHQNSGYQSISQSVNQSGQPSFSIIIIQNTPKINLNITQKHHTLSKTASIPNPLTTNRKKTHPHPHPAQRRCHTISQHTTRKLSPCSHPAQR